MKVNFEPDGYSHYVFEHEFPFNLVKESVYYTLPYKTYHRLIDIIDMRVRELVETLPEKEKTIVDLLYIQKLEKVKAWNIFNDKYGLFEWNCTDWDSANKSLKLKVRELVYPLCEQVKKEIKEAKKVRSIAKQKADKKRLKDLESKLKDENLKAKIPNVTLDDDIIELIDGGAILLRLKAKGINTIGELIDDMVRIGNDNFYKVPYIKVTKMEKIYRQILHVCINSIDFIPIDSLQILQNQFIIIRRCIIDKNTCIGG